MPNLVNDFEVRKETLRALGGNPDGLANIFEVDKEILKLISEGGSGIDWDTIKQKLAEDGVESIKFTMGNEEVILTAEEVKTLLNQPIIPEGKYMTITADKSNTGETIISPTVNGSLPNLNLQYRINNGDWMDFIVGTTADIHLTAGNFVQFKGVNESGLSMDYDNYLNFSISDLCHLSGNVMSLIDGVGEKTVIPNRLCFHDLFNNSAIKTVSSDFLPATTLQSECYRRLFSNCHNLTTAPVLPATTLETYCYSEMFRYCESLTTAPELPAQVLLSNCYGFMFEGCNSLNYVKCLATEGTIGEGGTDPDALWSWLSGVSSTGTFVKPAGVVYKENSSFGIPEGWTVKEIYEYVEAPMDGNQYARQDGAWIEVSKVKTTNNTTLQFWSGTQQEYDAIATKDANTLYIIK